MVDLRRIKIDQQRYGVGDCGRRGQAPNAARGARTRGRAMWVCSPGREITEIVQNVQQAPEQNEETESGPPPLPVPGDGAPEPVLMRDYPPVGELNAIH